MTKNAKIVPVILSGGAGSRLWPASRVAEPKQLLPLITDRSMIQETVARFEGERFYPPVFICNVAHADKIRAQMAEMGREVGAIIVEPVGRNTAPCAVVAALHAQTLDPDAVVLLSPADHHITKVDAFQQALNTGVNVAATGQLVTFGISPDHAATGFGYIRKGKFLGPDAFVVDKFVEKPPQKIAEQYFFSGDYVWNSGIFAFHTQTLLDEMERYAPGVSGPARASYEAASAKDGVLTLAPEKFAECEDRPVDKAVMEHTKKAAVIPCDIGWHDVGSFKALYELKADDQGMAIQGDVRLSHSSNILVDTDGPIVAVVGLDNVAVVVKEGRVLVLNLDRAQNVKDIVLQLKKDGANELL